MNSINSVTLLGRLGQDPEIRALSSGDEVCNLSIATTESWKDKSGEWQERTEWHRVVLFDPYLIKEVKKLSKGKRVYLSGGALQTRKWTDQNGVEKYTTEVVFQKFSGKLVVIDKAEKQPEHNTPEGDLDDSIPF